MENIRLIIEQIEAAKEYLQSDSLLNNRLALILSDNVAELLMHRELKHQFAMDDYFRPTWEPALTRWLSGQTKLQYTEEERSKAECEFLPKTRLLSLCLKRISHEDRTILDTCHRMRSETFHGAKLRHRILKAIAQLLYITTVDLIYKLPIQSIWMPDPEKDIEDYDFLERFGFDYPSGVLSNEGREQIVKVLLMGIEFDNDGFARVLSKDLLERIEAIIDQLTYLADGSGQTDVDYNLQFTQFFKLHGAELMKDHVTIEDLSSAFTDWKAKGKAKYTFHKINRWQKQAQGISRCKSPAKALERFWGIDKRLKPLEEDVSQAVFEYDEFINSQI